MRPLPLYSALLPCDRCGCSKPSVREDGAMRFRRKVLDLGWVCDDCVTSAAAWFDAGQRNAAGQLSLLETA